PSNLLRKGPSHQCLRIATAVERTQRSARHLPSVLFALELPTIGANAVDAKPGRCAVARQLARRTPPIGRADLQIGRYHGGLAVEIGARRARKITETTGDRSLVFGRLYNARDPFISNRAFPAAKIDLAVGGERIAIVTIGAGVGGRGMTRDQ